MTDKTIKHFIFTRFFSFYDFKYPYDIYDVNFLQERLPLTKNVLNSLDNQTNKDFDLIFVLNDKFFDDPKYEFIFSTLRKYTTLPIKFMKNVGRSYLFTPRLNREAADLLEAAMSEYDYVVTTRIDYDDFVYKDAVADTQAKVAECDKILGYGYCKGYEYVNGELYSRWADWGKKGHLGIFQSLILKSSFAKEMPVFSVEDFNHHVFKTDLKKFLEGKGIEFSDNMFQQNTSADAFIYYRNALSHAIVVNHRDIVQMYEGRKKLTTANITKKQLEEEFGFTLELNSIK